MIKYSEIKDSHIHDIYYLITQLIHLKSYDGFYSQFRNEISSYDYNSGIREFDLAISEFVPATTTKTKLFLAKTTIYVMCSRLVEQGRFANVTEALNRLGLNTCSIVNSCLRNYVNNNLI